MALTSGGDTGKTVVYTDRELTRPVLEHFGEFKDPNAPQFNVQNNGGADLITPGTTDVTEIAGVSVTHRLRSSLSATTRTDSGAIVTAPDGTLNGRVLTMTDDSFTGRVHGVSGQFRCVDTGTEACMITTTGTYNDDDALNENRLDMVTMSVAGGTLHFRPGNATASVSLCDDNLQCTAETDEEYMVFGWWREDPSSAAGTYQFGIFAEVLVERLGVSTTAPNDLNATYDGTAVGMYVEQDPNNAIDTHRQGEFTADVGLSVVSGSVSGTIDDFVTRPTGGSAAPRTADRWVVTLESATDGSDALINSLPGERSGSWVHAFVPPHATPADRSAGWLHLTGAFGAKLE